MTRRILIHQQAKNDLIEHFAYIANDKADPADRLLNAAQKLFNDLAHFPDLGRRWKTEAAHLQHIRVIPIPSFPNYLVFNRVSTKEVRVLTVLHGSRDLPALLRIITAKLQITDH